MLGNTIRLFLADGTSNGLITAEILNWSGHVLLAPREQLKAALARPEAIRTAVYFLIGDDPQMPSRTRVYVGEADCFKDRIRNHESNNERDFWTQVCVVTSSCGNLTKGHAQHLESKLVDLTKQAQRATIANGNNPQPPQLPESDIAFAERFLEQLKIVLPAIGLDFLKVTKFAEPGTQLGEQNTSLRLELRSGGFLWANAILAGKETIVTQGSKASKQVHGDHSYKALRQQLIDNGLFLDAADGQKFEFKTDVPFQSPSAAAVVILNRSANGRAEWKISGTNQSLGNWQDAQIAGG